MFRPIFEWLFVVLLLLSSMNFVTALSPSSGEEARVKVFSANVDVSSVAIEGGLYVYGGVLVLMHWRRVLRAARAVWPLLALAALACLSTTWSVQPIVTLRRSVELMSATTIAIYIGERYSIKAFARLLAQMFTLMMMLVLALYWVAPEYVIDYSAYGGAWKGLSAYKNTFGEHMVVAVLLLVLIRFERFCWTRYVFLLIAGTLLLLSRSATAVLCGVLGLATLPLWRLRRSRQHLLVYPLAALILFIGIYCVFSPPQPLLDILGRDSTLTGRTQLWGMLLPVIANRPILGYGYAAFWAGLKAEVLSVWIGAGRLVPIADNGYIDLCLSLGALGVCAFLFIFVRSFRRAVDYVRLEPGPIGLWPVTYLCLFAADNISESQLVTRATFSFMVFAIITTSLAINHRRVLTPARMADNRSFMSEWIPPVVSR